MIDSLWTLVCAMDKYACNLIQDAATATENEAEDPSPAPIGKPCDFIDIYNPYSI